jgi:aryl-alcohol dehydrogenase-like predicted oxidoreductase
VGETFAGLPFVKGVQLSKRVNELLPDMPMPQAALRWILDHPEVTSVIPGASSRRQVQGNTAASEVDPLSQEVHNQLRLLYDDEIRPYIRGAV